ncbi:hypothetical protein [uncultured Clostridium sp.]|uniref:hypothetical protein n=1 Tax=uncultured Clostridium sp. TaxID=59620 RepID=UPI0027DDCAF8|nr:hypothetical protein [uncultured Clostridium sp.]
MNENDIEELRDLMSNAVTILKEKKEQVLDFSGIKSIEEIIGNKSVKHRRRTMNELSIFADQALETWQIKLSAKSAFA